MAKNMTEGNPLKIILLFSVPVLLGNLFQQFYNMVDTIIVGQYLGEEALAAVGSTGCLMFLVLGFANGIAQGFGVMISHSYGAKDYKLLKHYVALSLLLTVAISVILTTITVSGSRLLLLWMNTPENIFELANNYVFLCYFFLRMSVTDYRNLDKSILNYLFRCYGYLHQYDLISWSILFHSIFCFDHKLHIHNHQIFFYTIFSMLLGILYYLYRTLLQNFSYVEMNFQNGLLIYYIFLIFF